MVLAKWLSQKGIYIVGAKRTAFGSFGGSLSKLSATELAVHATKAAIQDAKLEVEQAAELVDAVFVGNVIGSSADAPYLARHVALQSGLSPTTSTALTINRLCGSGFETVIQGATSLLLNDSSSSNIVVCAGTENMSNAPMQIDGNAVRWGIPLGKGFSARDSLWDGLTDSHIQTPMGVTAENLAKKYNITREESDEYAIRSQTLWGKAKEDGIFDSEMAPITISHKKKGDIIVDTDEHPRPETTLERISKLSPVFGGVVTAANASGICDGAGSIVLATEEAIQQHNLTPLARLVSCHVSGCDPNIMGIGPVQSIRQALLDLHLDLQNDVDRIEINEAFAPQLLACAKELNLDMDKTNIHGGAIALGHPLAASGSRIVAHLAHEFHTPGNEHHKIHVGSACIGGGQGIAVVLQRP